MYHLQIITQALTFTHKHRVSFSTYLVNLFTLLKSRGSVLQANNSHYIWPAAGAPQTNIADWLLQQHVPEASRRESWWYLPSRSLPAQKNNELVNLLVFEFGRFCCNFGNRWSVCFHKSLSHMAHLPNRYMCSKLNMNDNALLKAFFPGKSYHRITLEYRLSGALKRLSQHRESLRPIGHRHLTYRSPGSCIFCHAIVPWELPCLSVCVYIRIYLITWICTHMHTSIQTHIYIDLHILIQGPRTYCCSYW